MDDCNLTKLTVKPGTLTPPFKKDVTDYSVTVPSNIEKVTFDPRTSDTGASFSISGSGGTRDVPVKEGAITDIKIEVSAEDGTVKNYFVHVQRLSAKDAVLSSLLVKSGHLEPPFNPNQFLYYCLLPCHVAEAHVTPKAPDPKIAILVNKEPAGSAVPLNTGSTKIEVETTSPDESNKKIYELTVVRKQIPRFVKFTKPESATEFECPISLSPLYCPITVKGSKPKHTYSGPFITELSKISKIDPLNGCKLEPGWRIEDYDIDHKLATQEAVIPLTYSGQLAPRKFGELATNLAECNKPPVLEDLTTKFKDKSLNTQRTVQPTKWERALQQVHDETSPEALIKAAQRHLQDYYKAAPKPSQFGHQYHVGDSPMDFLQNAIHCIATAIKFKGKDANLHLQLAMVLEEKYYAEDLFGLKREDKDDGPSFNLQAKESSKEEEVLAICKLRGVDPSAPVSHHLKALDQEYHHLVESKQGGKSEHVQALYAWYSKKVSQEGAAAHKAEDNESPLGQAYQKYLDALCLDESKAVYNFHVGRLLVIQGNYNDAIKRLEATLCWNSSHEMARFYLGLAISLSKEARVSRAKEAIGYLLAGMEMMLTELSKQACEVEKETSKNSLFAENLLRISNVHFLRGLVQLGCLLAGTEVKEAISASDVFHTAALLACQVLPTVFRGDTYKQIEWVLLDAHTNLLELLVKQQAGNEDLISSRCQRLSALIFNSTIPANARLLELQEETCQKLVQIQPGVSYALFLLGSAQFSLFENTPAGDVATRLLKEARASFEASISLEGKKSDAEPLALVTEQKWWAERKKKEEEAKKAAAALLEAPPSGGKVSKPPAATTAAPAAKGRGATTAAAPSRGASTAAARGRGLTSSSSNTQTKGDKSRHNCVPQAKGDRPAVKPGAPAARGGPAASRGGARGGKTPAQPAAAAPAPAAKKVEEPAKKDETKKKEEESRPASAKTRTIITNPKSHLARLGLARALRAANEPNEAKKYYAQVIEMAPEIHDAYIESAEMLTKSNPLEAVDVYAKFPISKNPTFDDAFIFGEIVRILMKAEKYDDKRLAKNLIAYGKVLGVGVLERYTKTLEEKMKNDLLKTVYAGINNKSVDDPDMQAFFKFKFWI